MKTKIFFSSLALLFFALLGGGSISEGAFDGFLIIILVVAFVAILTACIAAIVQNSNQKKRLQMIKEDEENSEDFDRSVFVGDDRCKLYFDSNKKQVMIMRVMTEGIKKEYVDDFMFPGKDLVRYCSPVFYVFDPQKRRLLSVSYNDSTISYNITSVSDIDSNKDISINNTIRPKFVTHLICYKPDNGSISTSWISTLIDEAYGFIAILENAKVGKAFNYVKADSLPTKVGDKSTITTKTIGNYLFIMDDFFKVLVLVGPEENEVLKYSDIIEVTYEENGTRLFSKSAGRTVGGAIVGGVLMGGAGAVVGGLSGPSKQNKEVKSMDIKILLRDTSRTSCILHFNQFNFTLKTKNDSDRKKYESYLNNANQAKDVLSVIIDNAKQSVATKAQNNKSLNSSTTLSVADELAKLAKLKANGILTEEEFQTQKSKLLG